MDIMKCLTELCSISGPSGFEAAQTAAAEKLLKPYVDETIIDRAGNLIGVLRCGKSDAKRVLLCAHLDEIGLITSKVEDGFLRFCPIGGVDPRMLPGREVTIMTKPPVFGVVACLPPHVLSKEDMDKSIPMDKLFIDTGLSQEKAEKLIPPGTPITFKNGVFQLGSRLVCGKSLDNRACFAALMRAAEMLRSRVVEWDVYIVGSTQEERSSDGAIVAAYTINPDVIVAVDVTHAKTPDGGPENRNICLEAGPEIAIGPNMSDWMTDKFFRIADEKRIPVQKAVMEGNTYTDGWPMQIQREGFATSLVSLPLRYMHTPMEVVSLKDIELLAALLAEFIACPGGVVATC